MTTRAHFIIQFGSEAEGWRQSAQHPHEYTSVHEAIEVLTESDSPAEAPRPVEPNYRICRVEPSKDGSPNTVRPLAVYDLRIVFFAPEDGNYTKINEVLNSVARGKTQIFTGLSRLVV